MANHHLDWKKIEFELKPHPLFQSELVLKVSLEHFDELLSILAVVAVNPNDELKVELSKGITVFIKMTTSKTKLFLAKSQLNETVCSVHFAKQSAQSLIDALEALKSSAKQFSFRSLENVNPLSNFEFTIEVINA